MKKHTAERLTRKLREAEVLTSQARTRLPSAKLLRSSTWRSQV